MLGEHLLHVFSSEIWEAVGIDIEEADIRDRDSTRRIILDIHPELIIHAAAYTDVDGSEQNASLALSVNGEGTGNVAEGAKDVGARLVYISTDYVFPGTKEEAYTEQDLPAPINSYGKSKLAGEEQVQAIHAEHYIVRIAWLFGKPGRDFPSWLVNKVRKGAHPRIFSDQVGSPTYALDLARKLKELVENAQFGVYHLTNSGSCTRFEQAKVTLEAAGLDPGIIEPVSLEQVTFPAPRPLRTVMQSVKLSSRGISPLRPWDEAAREYAHGL